MLPQSYAHTLFECRRFLNEETKIRKCNVDFHLFILGNSRNIELEIKNQSKRHNMEIIAEINVLPIIFTPPS